MGQRQGQAGMRPGAAGSQYYGGKALAAGGDLRGQLQPGAHVAERAERIGAADRYHIRAFAAAAQPVGEGLQLRLRRIQRGDRLDLGIEQVEQQAIAVGQIVAVAAVDGVFQQRHAAQPQPGG